MSIYCSPLTMPLDSERLLHRPEVMMFRAERGQF
jgi:hypothetical protein